MQHKTPKRQSKSERERPSSRERGYDWQWEQLSEQFRIQNPLCEHCQSIGRLEPAREVDHIIPFQSHDDPLRLDWNNLQGLCRTCHAKKTRRTSVEYKRFVVTGKAGTGKTTWVKHHRTSNAILWDMDAVSSTMGFPLYPRPRDVAEALMAIRESFIDAIVKGYIARDVFVIIADETKAAATADRINAVIVRCSRERWRKNK